jgi:hypothetical protein
MYPETRTDCWATKIQVGISARSCIIINYSCGLHCLNPTRCPAPARQAAVASVPSSSMDFRLGNSKKSHQRYDSHFHRWYICSFELHCEDETAPVIPNSFMGGCAPHPRYLEFGRIPFPGLPMPVKQSGVMQEPISLSQIHRHEWRIRRYM